MTSRDFCYWLQGYFEIHNCNMPENMKDSRGGLSCHQADMIRNHLAMVFKHEIDPSMGPLAHQAALGALHVGDVGPQPGASTIGVEPPRRPRAGVEWHPPGDGLIKC